LDIKFSFDLKKKKTTYINEKKKLFFDVLKFLVQKFSFYLKILRKKNIPFIIFNKIVKIILTFICSIKYFSFMVIFSIFSIL